MDQTLEVFSKIANDDIQAYEFIFKQHYKFLCSYAYGLTKDKLVAEEITEDFFVFLWANRKQIVVTSSVRSYFISSIHNRCLNYLQREKTKFVSFNDISQLIDKEGTTGDKLIYTDPPSLLANELENLISKAISNLPDACKEVFLLSRYQEMSYDEIANKLNLSVNTVKTQIKIALSKLRDELKGYIAVLLILILK